MKRTPWIVATTLLAAALGLGAVVAPDNLPQALEAQRRLVAENPGDSAAWNDLGNLLTLGGQLDAAEESYERAVELAPDRAAYHFNFALLLQQQGKLRAARRHYRRVVELTPDNAWAWYQLGAIAEARGSEAVAVERYARALELDPQLGFPDVNPHVIDSELIGEAMLRGYRGGVAAPQAPRVYEEPARITSLLLPSLPAPGSPPEEPETAAERQAVQREMRGPTGQVPPPPEGPPAAAPGA
ncbi:MAG TPA: tetratricopeptide repeat protein, partial [Thermoanaerobaculia bacterium]|nr:tetratricopeptide repeat protein [Thermoanaerobaculia bacterium]